MASQVPEAVKKERFDVIMSLQQKISAENNLRFLGREIKVLVDERGEEQDSFIGRGEMDAPEVDGVIFLKGKKPVPGQFSRVKVTGTLEYDLVGEAE